MSRALTVLACGVLWLAAPAAAAQDAGRGARLYLGLPAGQASCVECHGPDPGANRNRLLKAAQGPEAIRQAISHAAAMGYLAELLDATALADLSAWLSLVSAESQDDAPAQVWPWGLEFGSLAPGSAVSPQPVVLHNTGPGGLWLAPLLRATVPGGAAGLRLSHDCPGLLEPRQRCTAWVWLDSARAGRAQAALEWGDSALRPVGVSAWVQPQPAGIAGWRDGADASWAVPLEAGRQLLLERVMVNDGPAPLTLGVPAITGPGRAAFRIEGGGCASGRVLGPGEACAVRLLFDARAAAAQQALLQWRNDGAHPQPVRLEVQPVVAAPAPSPSQPPSPSPLPPPSPPAVPQPAAPAPPAQPQPAAPQLGAGGCSVALPAARPDLTMPGLVIAALLVLLVRALRRPPQPPSCPRLHSSLSAPGVPLPGGNS
jgi:hypothetical protein